MSAQRDPELDALKEEDIFEEAKDRLQISRDAEEENEAEAKEDMLFREGDQWEHDIITTASQDTPELVINLTDAMCQRVENNIRQQRPRAKSSPVGDGVDVSISEVLDGALRHIEARSEASVAYDTSVSSSVTGGVGYFRLLVEYEHERSMRQELRILPIMNPFTVHMDPEAIMPAGQDMGWCLLSNLMKRSEFKRRYPKAENIDWKGLRDRSLLDWENKESIRLAEYFRITTKIEKLYSLLTPAGEKLIFESERPRDKEGKPIDWGELARQGLVQQGMRESQRKAVQWFYLNGLKVIDRQTLPGQWIPVFRVIGNVRNIDGKVIRRGMVRNMRDPQRMVNYGEVAKIKRLGLSPKSQWIVAEGQLEGHEDQWRDANITPFPYLLYKPITVQTPQGELLVPPPQRQQPAPIEAGFAEFVQGMRTNLLAVAGQPHEPGADATSQVVSGKALQRRAALSDQSHFQYYDNLTYAVAQCGRVCLEYIPVVYHEPGRLQRIIGEDTQARMVKLNEQVTDQGEDGQAIQRIQNDMSVGRYDVTMDTGPGYETRREEGAESLLELLKSPPLAALIAQHGADLVFRSIDHPYMQELADRLQALTPQGLEQVMERLPERARSFIRALAQQLQQAQQALQQAVLENKYHLAGKQLEAQVKTHGIDVGAETKRIDTAVRSHTELGKEEVRAGATLLNTRTEAIHHPAAAQEVIAAGERVENGGM